MRRLEPLRKLARNRDRFFDCQRTTRNSRCEVLPIHQLDHQRRRMFDDAVDLSDILMVESGERPGLSLEARPSRCEA